MKCFYAECCLLSVSVLVVVNQYVEFLMLSMFMLSMFMLNMFMLSMFMLSIVVFSVVMVSVVIQIMVKQTYIVLSVFKLRYVILLPLCSMLSAIVLRPSVMVPTLNTFFFCRNKTFSYL